MALLSQVGYISKPVQTAVGVLNVEIPTVYPSTMFIEVGIIAVEEFRIFLLNILLLLLIHQNQRNVQNIGKRRIYLSA